ncbi:MAG: arginase [Acidobacteria bacterium OLB17]|nr:MAG: arginase [Acidobacteria bacterium OLB17]MCZ2392086.1 arginase [Acidobacteriota bacterium]
MGAKKIGLLGVPLGFGAGKTGSELGVNAMRLSMVRGQRLADHIRGLGFEFVDHGDVQIQAPRESAEGENPKHLAEMLASSENVIRSVSEILRAGEFPVILGGDHSIAIPTFSAISSHFRENGGEVGLIWFDAHADINTPESSPSGNIHGMPLAVLLGEGDSRLVDLCGFSPKLNKKYFAHIGARDIDPGERAEIEKLGLRDHFFTMSDIDRRGMAACVADAVKIASAAPAGFAVTFDVDGIDPRFAPGSGTLVRGGATYREAHLALEMIAENGRMLSFEIVEVNPLLDQSNITVELACELILSALGKTIL